MILTAIDVSEFAHAAGCSVPHVAVSMGALGTVASSDPHQRAILVGMLVKELLEGPLERREIDADHWVVTFKSKKLPGAARTFVISRADRPGGHVVVILTGFEIEIAGGAYTIEILERQAGKAEWLQ